LLRSAVRPVLGLARTEHTGVVSGDNLAQRVWTGSLVFCLWYPIFIEGLAFGQPEIERNIRSRGSRRPSQPVRGPVVELALAAAPAHFWRLNTQQGRRRS